MLMNESSALYVHLKCEITLDVSTLAVRLERSKAKNGRMEVTTYKYECYPLHNETNGSRHPKLTGASLPSMPQFTNSIVFIVVIAMVVIVVVVFVNSH
jgi:hypothetical protein